MAEDDVDEEDWFEQAVSEEPTEQDESAAESPTEQDDSVAETPTEQDESAAESPTEQDDSVAETPTEQDETALDEPAEQDDTAAEPESDWAEAMADLESEAGTPEPESESFETSGEEALDIDVEGGESFGFDVGEEETTEFEEGDYQTVTPRVTVGIEGLDEMIQEGVPERSLLSVIGGAGTGKTTFALQFLQEALASDGKGVFITLEESRDRIYKSAQQKGWDFEGAAAEGSLAVLDLDPVDMANSLTSIRSELPRLVENYGADRLVLDSVSLLEMMYDDQATRRTEIYDFARALKAGGVTTLVTSEAAENTPYASRFGIIEYLTDAVFVLQYVRPEDFQETRMAVEIQKIRDANHSRETKPYEITNEGISVYRDATIF
ncbi:KaiC domain-containing protein [Halodesulfurarchaeum sp.]|uniref:KaiC domain-containing protein n=1 Tax=Halodesulfurarchaeum sp. TaxID=1980530 RepID=UPI002FC3D532